jgi:hypothetical protein
MNNSPKLVETGWPKQKIMGSKIPFGRRISAEKGKQSPSLLYVLTGFLGDARYGPNYWYGDTNYLLHQIDVVNHLDGLSNYQVLVKGHPKSKVRNPLDQHIKEKTGGHVKLVSNENLQEILPQSDVVLIDWPSTTLLETMIFNKPLIYLDLGWLNWDKNGKQSVKAVVEWVDKENVDWKLQLNKALQLMGEREEIDYSGFLEEHAHQYLSSSELAAHFRSSE